MNALPQCGQLNARGAPFGAIGRGVGGLGVGGVGVGGGGGVDEGAATWAEVMCAASATAEGKLRGHAGHSCPYSVLSSV